MESPGTGSGTASASSGPGVGRAGSDTSLSHFLRHLSRRFKRRRNGEAGAAPSLSELIERREDEEIPLSDDERRLVANILEVRDTCVEDAMVPRADIIAIDSEASLDEVLEVMTREGHSRLPVYRQTLDDALGMVHIRDVLAWLAKRDAFSLSKILRRVLFVAPSMKVLELLLEMRVKRCHMALVVDEFGGVDGLVTIEDLVEEIVGDIEDEHDQGTEATYAVRPDGAIDADARTPIEVLEEHFGPVLEEEERDEIDTMGGLVFALAGHVPIRGELIVHPAGLEFEVLDADPRRIRRLRVRKAGTAAEVPAAEGRERPAEP